MKTYSSTISTADALSVLVVPSGTKLPVDPKNGSLFYLIEDAPEPVSSELPWHSRALYWAQDGRWLKVIDEKNRGGHGVIGACTIEVEEASSTKVEPILGNGYTLTTATITPVHRKTLVTGAASLWVEAEKDCHAWVSVFRETEPFVYGYEETEDGSDPVPIMRNFVMVGLVGMKLPAMQAVPVSITFADNPASDKLVTYVLQINCDQPGFLSINQCSAFRFNGASSTALILSQH